MIFGYGGERRIMSVQAKRFGLLIIALSILSVSLVACQTPNPTNSGPSNAILIPTPNSAKLSPTPQFPQFTVGAWPSNFAPQLNDTVTIYVVCRVQDQTMKGPSHPPPAGLPVTIYVGNPIAQQQTAHTTADGYAVASFSFNDPNPGLPVTVSVTTNWNNVAYKAQTFFTPGPNTAPTPTAGASPAPGGPGGPGQP